MPETKRRRSSGEPSVVIVGVSAARMPEVHSLLKSYGITNVKVSKHVPRFSRQLTEAFNRGKQKALSGTVALPATIARPKARKHAPRSARDLTAAFESGKQKALGNLKKRRR